FADDREQDPPAVPDDAQVALSVQTLPLVARHLDDPELRPSRPNVHHGLDLEAVAVEVELRETSAPKGVIAVAEVAVAGSMEHVGNESEDPVPAPPQERNVGATAALNEAGSLCEVRPMLESLDEPADLGGIRRA